MGRKSLRSARLSRAATEAGVRPEGSSARAPATSMMLLIAGKMPRDEDHAEVSGVCMFFTLAKQQSLGGGTRILSLNTTIIWMVLRAIDSQAELSMVTLFLAAF